MIAGFKRKVRGPVVTKQRGFGETMAGESGIGLDTAHGTLAAMMQFGVRRILHLQGNCMCVPLS